MNNDIPFLSIIVPVYNVEDYLPICLNSILSQSFRNYELLLIDDGSTDSSAKICDDYALSDSRIRVFHKQNEGVSIARNLGISQVKGDWIYFVDSDDELVSGCLDLLTSKIRQDVDIIEGRYFTICKEQSEPFYDFSGIEMFYTKAEYIYNLYHYIPKQYHGFLWNKIFRAEVIKKARLRFNASIFFKEDGLFIMEYVCNMKNKVLFFHDLLYLYYKRETGMAEQYLGVISAKSVTHLEAVNLMYEVSLSQNLAFRTKCAAKDAICRSYRKLNRGQINGVLKKKMDSMLGKYISKQYYFCFCCRQLLYRFIRRFSECNYKLVG